jgi:asparagine synthase (glutamine-hydrolysing)
MCGIVGIKSQNQAALEKSVLKMLDLVSHRGPDARTHVVSGEIAMGNARLSITDLSCVSNQPMTINEFTIVFNGEIYNYKQIRTELQQLGEIFDTDSDTEVVLRSFIRWGEQAFSKFNGMWAIAIYNSNSKSLHLSRDRFGVKPLYWTCSSGQFAFSSEIKGLLPLLRTKTMNKAYFANAIQKNHVDFGFASPIEEVQQLPAGSCLRLGSSFNVEVIKWWVPETETNRMSLQDQQDRFKELLVDSIKLRIPEEVTYGYSLSAGLDSNAIFSTAATNRFFGYSPIGVFNLSYQSGAMDESIEARKTAELFDMRFNSVVSDPSELLSNLEDVVWTQEGIGWNPSILAYHFFYSEVKKLGVKVLIEGHGADEILGGYPGMVFEYLTGRPRLRDLAKLIPTLRMIDSSGNSEVEERTLGSSAKLFGYFLKSAVRARVPSSYEQKLERLDQSLSYVFEDFLHRDFYEEQLSIPRSISGFKKTLYLHTLYKTLPQILRVFDRASMAHGIESRAPFLDYRIFEHVLSMDEKLLLSSGCLKPALRLSMANTMPAHIMRTNIKRGFGSPLQEIFSNESVSRYLLSQQFIEYYKSAMGVNEKVLIKNLKSQPQKLSRQQLVTIWQAITFSIFQAKFL